jgi:hypothetical protein
MSSGNISFIAWAVAMLAMLGVLVWAARHSRSRSIQQDTEDAASSCLPEIGKIATKKHQQRFGRAPTDAPSEDSAWYPETKKKVVKASG